MTVVEFLSSLAKQDIRLWVEGENLRFNAPDGAFTSEVRNEIVARKAEIIAFLASATQFSEGSITLAPRDKPLKLSFSQQRLWLLDQLDPGSVAYSMPVILRLEGILDAGVLQQAFTQIVNRHEILRTRFDEVEGDTVQIVSLASEWPLPVVDLSDLSEDEQKNKIREQVTKEVSTPFDLLNGPVFRTQLIQLSPAVSSGTGSSSGGTFGGNASPARYVLLANMHHIVCDGWSMGLLVKELASFYASLKEGGQNQLPPLEFQYADYAHWQRQWLQGEVLERQLNYWRGQLAGVPVLALPTDHVRPPIVSDRGVDATFELPVALSQSLNELALENEVTLFMLLLTAFNVFLYRYSSQTDICVGCPIANRGRHELEPLIGCFVNTLALRNNLEGDPRFHELLKQVKKNTTDAYNHQDLPFEYLVDELGVVRDMSHTPLFQTFFVLQNQPDPLEADRFELSISPIESGQHSAKFDLSLAMAEQEGALGDVSLVGTFSCREDLFEKESIKRLATNWECLLQSIVENPQERVSRLGLIGEAERQRLLVGLNQTHMDIDAEVCLHQLVERQVERDPDDCALVFGHSRISYQELNERANQLARNLQTLGVHNESLVGICIERGIEMVVGILAILKSGAAYVPLDPAYPKERLHYMLAHSGTEVLLTQSKLRAELFDEGADVKANVALKVVCIDNVDGDGWQREAKNNISLTIDPQQLAYVIYTSGSTGVPKGIAIEHGNATALVQWAKTVYSKEDLDGVLASTSICFDLSIWEIFVTLASGGKLIIAENALALPFIPAVREVRLVNTVPSVMVSLLRDNSIPDSVRIINLAGEVLKQSLVDSLYATSGIEKVYDLYGPSEDTTYSTFVLRKAGGSPSIGRPIANTRVYVLSNDREPVPFGASGELYLAGRGIARGYLHDRKMTAEKFVANPFVNIKNCPHYNRMYQTGDLVRYLPDGRLEYLGRIDDQVKVRGFRIELGEVESALLRIDGIEDALASTTEALDENPLIKYTEDTILICYIVLKVEIKSKPPTVGSLRSLLKAQLPDYMIPSAFIIMDKFPLTPNGKVDRQRLPEPDLNASLGSEHIAPRTKLEVRLAVIWENVLNIESVGVRDNFFDLGGHSLIATQVVSRMRRDFEVELSLRQLFTHPTIEGIAELIQEAQKKSPLIAPEIQPITFLENERIPLSFAQQRMWIVDQLEPDSVAYNMPGAFRVKGALDKVVLRRTLQSIIDRHEVLRTTFTVENDNVSQRIYAPQDYLNEVPDYFSSLDLSHLQGKVLEKAVEYHVSEEATRGFNLQVGPLFRVQLLVLASDDYVVLTTMHHIISDGWSMSVLTNEIQKNYSAYLADEPSPLEPLAIQYADFSVWQRRWLEGDVLEQQINYWRKTLNGFEVLALPIDYPRSVTPSYQGAAESFSLDDAITQKLNELSKNENCTLYMTLLAVINVLLSRYSGQQDIVVGSPIANRNRGELEPLIGYFVNTIAIRTDLTGDPAFTSLMGQVKESTLGAYAHQDVPFERLVDELDIGRDLSRTPLFQVLFTFQNTPVAETVDMPGLSMTTMRSSSAQVKFDLMINMGVVDGQLQGAVRYKTALFSKPTISRMTDNLERLLTGIAEDASRLLSELPLISKGERSLQVEQWNNTALNVGEDITLHELFRQQAARDPDRLAVVYQGNCVSYLALDDASDRMARQLVALGVRWGDVVALYRDRSITLIDSILAIWKAGAAYVPIDPSYPEERVEYMLEDCTAKVVITDGSSGLALTTVAEKLKIRMLIVEDYSYTPSNPDDRSRVDPAPRDFYSDVDGPAYVIYTSGTTGQAKGTVVSHRNVVNLMHGLNQSIYADVNVDVNVDVEDASGSSVGRTGLRVAMNASPAFDAMVKQLIQILQGGTLYPIPQAVRLDVDLLSEFLRDHQIDVFDITPSQLSVLINESSQCRLPKKVLVGGEAITQGLWDTLAAMEGSQFYNVYGPTECTVDTTVALISVPGSVPHIGKPIANVSCYVLDRHLSPVPLGVIGELYIGGAGVALGYLNQPALVAEKFIDDPFETGRLYKTGDLVRYLDDGNLQFMGRQDGQVKLRGYRIELGEVEAALVALADVAEATVQLHAGSDEEEACLVAYVVTSGGTANTQNALLMERSLLSSLAGRLPPQLIPQRVMILTHLPLSVNGKVDKQALPRLELHRTDAEYYLEPRNEIERAVARVWETVLRRERISVDDNFFSIGGHSLLATRVVSRLRRHFKVKLPLRQLFEEPSIEGLAASIQRALADGEHYELDYTGGEITRANRQRKLPLSFAQQRLWILEQLDPGGAAYNMPIAIRLKGEVNPDILQQALTELVKRHEILRTTFHEANDDSWQQVHPATNWPLPIIDYYHLTTAEATIALETLASNEAKQRFDLSAGPLMRSTLVKMPVNDEWGLLVTLHHMVCDGWSLGLLVQELAALYDAFRKGGVSTLPSLPIQYADFAQWQHEWLGGHTLQEQVTYWRKQIKPESFVLNLPTDVPRALKQSVSGGSVSLTIPKKLSDEINRFNQQEGCTLYMFLLAAFDVLLARYTGQEIINVGSPIAGRNREEIEPLVGFFINTLVMSVNVSGNPSFRVLLNRVRDVALNAYTHQDLPFEKLVEELNPPRDLSRTPLFQVFLNVLNLPSLNTSIDGVSIEGLYSDEFEAQSKFDLTLYVKEMISKKASGKDTSEGIALHLVYNHDLYSASRMALLLKHVEMILQSVVTNPDAAIGKISLFQPNELLSNTAANLPVLEKAIPEIQYDSPLTCFEKSVVEYGASVAIVDDHEQITREQITREQATHGRSIQREWTYHQVDDASSRVGDALMSVIASTIAGTAGRQIVAIYAARQANLVVALLACFKAELPFVILDPAIPEGKLVKMIQSVNPTIWLQLTADGLSDLLEAALATQSIIGRFSLATQYQSLMEQVELDSALLHGEGHVARRDSYITGYAYYSFTSGTTGDPKLIATGINPLSHFLHWYRQEFQFDHHDRFSGLSGLAHDPLLRDIFTPLSVGARLYLPGGESLLESGGLARWFINNNITVTHLSPAIAQLLVEFEAVQPSHSLRLVCYGGEGLKWSDVDQLKQFAPVAEAVNFYGATETPQVMAYKRELSYDKDGTVFNGIGINGTGTKGTGINGTGTKGTGTKGTGTKGTGTKGTGTKGTGTKGIVTIGRGIEGVDILVLNKNQSLAAISEVGEICIRTPYLSKGYLNDLDLTEQRFKTVTWSGQEESIYCTGDLGRYCVNGEVEFLGRSDAQANVRGYRVELGEIETALRTIDWVQRACVLVDEANLLVAYLVAPSLTNAHLDTTQIERLRQSLFTLLPSYMIPTAYVVVDSIPLTANGKVSRAMLPKVDPHNLSGVVYIEPMTEVEKTVAAIWQDILKVEKVGLKDNFFNLGGHSLLATKVVARIKSRYEVELPLRSLFEEPTLGNATKYVETTLWLRENELNDDLDEGDREEFEL